MTYVTKRVHAIMTTKFWECYWSDDPWNIGRLCDF